MRLSPGVYPECPDGKWDPLAGQNSENRYIRVSASGVELKGDGKIDTNIGCTDVNISPNTKSNCDATCNLDPAKPYHKVKISGHYSSSGQGQGSLPVWNASGRTTDYDVRLDYMDNEPVKTAEFDKLAHAKLIIEGDLQGKKIKLVGDGVDITNPEKEYTASADFTFKPNRISAAQDDLSISAVDNNGNAWDKVTLMSYLLYKPAAQACLKQRKDTNTLCEKCAAAHVEKHDGDKPHPDDDYAEIPKCEHCNNNCTRAVVVTMGKKAHQDEVFQPPYDTLTKNHGVGARPEHLDYMAPIAGTSRQDFAQKVYSGLKAQTKLCAVQQGAHSLLAYGITMNDKKGKIDVQPSILVSDPSCEGVFILPGALCKGMYK